MSFSKRLHHYAELMRLDKPIGTLLLLWPTLWALWLAASHQPTKQLLFIFVAGVFLMRSTGCIMNDIADRHVDGHVARTKSRPLASGQVSVKEAVLLMASLATMAFLLVLQCNWLTIQLAFAGALFTVIYPFLKRVTHLPQLGLGIAFSWGVPMAFAAVTGAVPARAWLLFAACVLWPVIYDTMYAMVDREDDNKIGVKSTAILFSTYDRLIIALLQIIFVLLMIAVGMVFQLRPMFYLMLVVAAILFLYQQWLIKDREPASCFRAFLNNNWVGLVIFVGVVVW
jgi:4-hydroxybenzoate polyprenyltransferase